jgi:Ca2+-transporting ATPase
VTVPLPPRGVDAESAAAGLSTLEAERRLRQFGANTIRAERQTGAFVLLARQFASPVIWLLLAASGISAVAGERVDAAAIVSIVVLNACIGFVQEYRAERAVFALRSMTARRARVRRDGRIRLVLAAAVVPGDALVLEAGDVVAADARIRSAHVLAANEAVLTGESLPVEKEAAPVTSDAPLAERTDTVFMGTSITTGTGIAEVVATGMHTELGRIAHLLANIDESATPLQIRLARVTGTLVIICLGVVALVALFGVARGTPAFDVFIGAVTLAVAAVPEGLPAIVTIALAIGVQRMAGRHVLVRRMNAVETLGCVTVICTDKTGTLTTGVMRVRDLWGPDHERLLYAAAACCDAELTTDGHGTGDPTELAILAAAAERGIHRAEIERLNPRISEMPFDPVAKRMSVERADGSIYSKGALESLLPSCGGDPSAALSGTAQMAGRGLRVLAVTVATAHRHAPDALLGLIGMADPPRAEAIAAVSAARRAGITTVMITGDHPVTAAAIAKELGIATNGDIADVVHARTTPEDKLTIVRRWKGQHAIVAMTGDGVNDAPAVREAHVGIAMGRSGSEVTREASDIILADDNFASIVAGIREGRGVFDNIRKALVYLLSGNAAELLLMLVASAMGLPLPLLPIHLLWINVITDGLPALALVMEPVEADVLQRPPRPMNEAMLGRAQWRFIVATGVLQACTLLTLFVWALRGYGLHEARSLTFAVIVLMELFRAFAARSVTRVFFEVGWATNLRLLAVVAASAALQAALHHVPFTERIFDIDALTPLRWVLAVLVALIPVSAIELAKLLRR